MGEVKRSANSFYTYMIIWITVLLHLWQTTVNKGEIHSGGLQMCSAK